MNNSIRRQGQRGGMAIIAIIVLTIGLAALSINQIRMGGPIHREKVVITDFRSDTTPTPLYVVEPFLEVALMKSDPANFPAHRQRLAELERGYREKLTAWTNSELDPDLKSELVNTESKDSERFWKEVNDKMIPAMESQNPEQITAAFAAVEAAFNTHAASIRKLVADAKAAEQALSESADSTLMWSSWLLVALSLAILGTIMFSLRYLTRRALDPLAQTADTMSRMAAGDLEVGRTIHHSDDEIGEMTQAIEVFRATSQQQIASEATQRAVVLALSAALNELAEGNLTYTITTPLAEEYEGLRATFNQTVTELAALMASVNASAASVNTGAAEIRAASDDLALRNEQQAASLEETAAAMNQVTGTVSETARGAVEVRKAIETAHGEATEGGSVVQRAMTAMSAIEQSSQEIGQIVNVIDSIAFQTNLLALNAGVEAARAGDAGKGFAVVANEVRALAQRSADAAKDIKGLINNSSGQVTQGVTLVGETGTLLEKIVTRVGEVNELISEIARSTESQASSLQQVNIAVGEMDRMTQQNASMVEESTAAARSLADEASEVTRLVAHFRTGAAEKSVLRGRSASLAAPASRRKPAPAHTPAPAMSQTMSHTMSMPTHGNLALKPVVDEDDWAEF